MIVKSKTNFLSFEFMHTKIIVALSSLFLILSVLKYFDFEPFKNNPFAFLLAFLLYFTLIYFLFCSNTEKTKNNIGTDSNKKKAINSKSKYITQSTPNIVLNELHQKNINLSEIKIVSGFNINDLKKRIIQLNPNHKPSDLEYHIESAREVAFSSKYASPNDMEDEKLVDISILTEKNIMEWHQYLGNFLSEMGIINIRDLDIINVGIGNAQASHIFFQNCHNLTGIDISRSAISYAKDRLQSATLIKGSAENLKKIPSWSQDLYISLRTYQSTLFDIKTSIHEAYRVLRKGSNIVISIPTMFLKKDDNGKVIGNIKGLIPPDSKIPSMEYAEEIVKQVEDNLHILGFQGCNVSRNSPFEIYIGATK